MRILYLYNEFVGEEKTEEIYGKIQSIHFRRE